MENLRRMRWLVAVGFCLLTAVDLFGLAKQARADGVWYVKNGGDDAGDCASAATACATIGGVLAQVGFVAGDTIKVGISTFTGTGNQVVFVDKDVILSGGWNADFTAQTGMSTVDGQNARVGMILQTGVVQMDHFMVVNGFGEFGGGGIGSQAVLTIDYSIVSNNRSSSPGGGISAFRDLTINHSTISHNTMGSGSGSGGGGGVSSYYGPVTIQNSTLSDNKIISGYTGTALSVGGNVLIVNSTITGNSGAQLVLDVDNNLTMKHVTLAGNVGKPFSGQFNGNVNIENSIFANNSGKDCFKGASNNTFSFNLVETNGDCALDGTNKVGKDPLLNPLANHGGTTQTMPLVKGSPAIDTIPTANCLILTDQRDVVRPQGIKCDMGAYEATGSEPSKTATYTPTFTTTPKPTHTMTPTHNLSATPKPTHTPLPTHKATTTRVPGKIKKIFSENFEGSFPSNNWQITAEGWEVSTCEKYAGNFSAWGIKSTGASCGDNYPVSQNNWMVHGPFSLKKAKAADVYFRIWLNAEEGKDSLFVGASTSGKKFYGVTYTGTTGNSIAHESQWDAGTNAFTNGEVLQMPLVRQEEKSAVTNVSWGAAHFDLTNVYKIDNLAGKKRVWIAFVWHSDDQNTLPNGVFVDDVLITQELRKK